MKTIVTYITLFILVITCLTTCKKYPEGGYIKRAPKFIIGEWKLTLYEVNGIDSTDLINYNGTDNYKKNVFSKHHNSDSEIIIDSKGSIASKSHFTDKNRKIEFYTNDPNLLKCISGYCYRNYFLPEGGYYNEWLIIKLTKNELKLKCGIQNTYFITFQK